LFHHSQLLASFCKFGSFLNDALRDRFIVELSDESFQRKLLGVDSLTFEETYTIALDSKLVCKQTQQMNNSAKVNFVSNKKSVSRQKKSSSKLILTGNEKPGG
jgi:hypothetical protein